MLAQRGHASMRGSPLLPRAGRQQRGHRAGRRIDFAPAVARLQLRMLPHVVHVLTCALAICASSSRADHLLGGQRGEGVDDERAQLVARGAALRVGGEALVGGQLGLQQHLARRTPPTRARSAGPASPPCRRRPGTGRTDRSSRGSRRCAAAARRRRTRSTADSSSTRPAIRASRCRCAGRGRSAARCISAARMLCRRTCRRRCRRSTARPSTAPPRCR